MSRKKLNHRINVTPLADVMLVLLIIFMVVTPLLGPGVDVDVPQAEHPTEHPDSEDTLVVSLRGDGNLFLNTEPIAPSAFETRLTQALDDRASKTLYLKADRALDYAGVLEMMDVCRRSGATEIALITREKEPSSP